MGFLLKNRYLHLVLAALAFAIMYYSPNLFSNEKIDIKLFNQKLNSKEQLAKETLNKIITDNKQNKLLLLQVNNRSNIISLI